MKRLFPAETHATDPDTEQWIDQKQAEGAASLPKIMAWCGKRCPPQAIARNGVKPTCYQCGLIWEKDRVLATAAPAPAGQPKMTLGDCMRLLASTECEACRGTKLPKMAFCRTCYSRLPGELKAALYRRYGQGFEKAYFSAMEILKPARPAA